MKRHSLETFPNDQTTKSNVTSAPSDRFAGLTTFLKSTGSHCVTHIALGIGILLLDFWTGPLFMFPILFVVPVALAAFFCSIRLAYLLAVALPLGRFLIAVFVDVPGEIGAGAVNGLVRMAVLCFLAFLVDLTSRQRQKIKVLHGLLPICMCCKRIRNADGTWQKLETYIADHSEADFSHGLCPPCQQKYHESMLAERRSA